MRLCIAGTRTFSDYRTLCDALEGYVGRVSEVVSGGAIGADRLGERWANSHKIPIRLFRPDWDKYGKLAGPLRNVEMAEYADELVAFWDLRSKGTHHMMREMTQRKKPVTCIAFQGEAK